MGDRPAGAQPENNVYTILLMIAALQVVGATINFAALLVNGKHLFELPFTSLESIVNKKPLLEAKKRVKGETVEQN